MSHRTFDDPHGTSTAARQGLLDNRCEHGPKRHRTLGRRRRLSKAKKKRIKAAYAKRLAELRAFKKKVRAYWLGELDEHPTP